MKLFSKLKRKKSSHTSTKSVRVSTKLNSAVILMLLLVLIVVGGSWFVQINSKQTIDRITQIGYQANSNLKNAYIYSLQSAGQIGTAIDINNQKQRMWELGQADKLLENSKNSFDQLIALNVFNDSEGENLEHMLTVTFKEYWANLDELKAHAEQQDYPSFESLKRGKLRTSDRNMDRVFNLFEKYIDTRTNSSIGQLDQLFDIARLGSIGLLVLAVIISLLIYRLIRNSVLSPLRAVRSHLNKIASGDLGVKIYPRSNDEIGSLLHGLKTMRDSLEDIIAKVRQHMAAMTRGAQHIATGNLDLSSRTDQQAASLQETAASMEQLASTVKQNADNAKQANQLANTASEVASRGGSVVEEVVHTMDGISDSSHKIADIVNVIDSIAFQTNILALNAAVEAARAGEQGRGFAVVAGEVRALAQRSANAAREIKDLIDDSVSRVSAGSDQVKKAGETMQEIVQAVSSVSDIMGEITAATIEQSSGIDQINLAVVQMDTVTQQNAQLVQDAANSATSLETLANEVGESLQVFKLSNDIVIDNDDTATAPAELKRPNIANNQPAPQPAPSASPKAPALPAKTVSQPAADPATDEWEEF